MKKLFILTLIIMPRIAHAHTGHESEGLASQFVHPDHIYYALPLLLLFGVIIIAALIYSYAKNEK